MGTKRALATAVAEQVAASPPGPLLDAFAGMCSVGAAVGSKRPIWNNDLQIFAATVSNMYFCAGDLPATAEATAGLLYPPFSQNRSALLSAYSSLFAREQTAIACETATGFEHLANLVKVDRANREEEQATKPLSHHFPYELFVGSYANSYFGVLQCIEIDSIRFALDHGRRCGLLSDEKHQWLLLALGRAMSRCTASTGHFAQPLSPKPNNIRRYVKQRSRSIWLEWLGAISQLRPLGTQAWRTGNRSFRRDTLDLLANPPTRFSPAVIYADPPYTKDQYSRYYHLYETLILYDYPATSGSGLYRNDRAASNFSKKTSVERAFQTLINEASKVGADLVVSYPVNGLLGRSEQAIPDLMSSSFRCVHKPVEISHVHSTMGGSKGEASNVVTEVLYRATAW